MLWLKHAQMLSQPMIERLKTADPDRYRASLFAPKDLRDNLHLLYAFHLELAKVPELVSEPMVGAIRYQWWREAIEEIYSGGPVRSHEITTPLNRLLLDNNIPRYWVDQLVDGRERDLDPKPFADISAAQDYCDQTSGVLLKMAVKLCEENNSESEIYETLGRAWGMTGLARAWRFYKSGMLSNIAYEALLDDVKLTYRLTKSTKISTPTIPACAYVGLVPGYLKRMNKLDVLDVNSRLHYSAVVKHSRMLRVVLSGKI